MFDLRSILGMPAVYRLFGRLIGADRCRSIYVKEYIRPKSKDRVLDIGCGPGDILEYLGDVEYVGFDMDARYIDAAKKRFRGRGAFFRGNVSEETIKEYSGFDIVLANGVLHHLNDAEAMGLLRLAKKALKPSGRLVTLDGCLAPKQSNIQSGIARYIILKDRGQYVRTEEDYVSLASGIFRDVRAECRSDLLNIPYTHIIMVCMG
ncbi:MAG: class I SAM-dependent methyltransferase [Deltaproteobacteria bacterium]|nr:class I SAM-dependent methyltransferase [Deltaproteobacteria bacterium]